LGITKSAVFSEKQNTLAGISKVLGHPARIAILEHLINLQTFVCGDLVKVIGLAQAIISQHLKELKKIGIIKGTIEGTSFCYCIDIDNWERVATLLHSFLNIKNNVNSC